MATVYYVVGMRFKKIKIDLNIEQTIVVTNNKEKNWCIGKRPLSKVQMMRCTFLYDLKKKKISCKLSLQIMHICCPRQISYDG